MFCSAVKFKSSLVKKWEARADSRGKARSLLDQPSASSRRVPGMISDSWTTCSGTMHEDDFFIPTFCADFLSTEQSTDSPLTEQSRSNTQPNVTERNHRCVCDTRRESDVLTSWLQWMHQRTRLVSGGKAESPTGR